MSEKIVSAVNMQHTENPVPLRYHIMNSWKQDTEVR